TRAIMGATPWMDRDGVLHWGDSGRARLRSRRESFGTGYAVRSTEFRRKRGRVTPSPPRSECIEPPTPFCVVGEREGVRGPALLDTSFPLTPSLSPTGPKRHAVLLRFDRGGEGVTRDARP